MRSLITKTRILSSVALAAIFLFGSVPAAQTFAAPVPPSTNTITASAGAGGSITPSGAVSVANGHDQTFTITPDASYHIATLVVDSATTTATSTYTFSHVTADHTISATFAINDTTAPVIAPHADVTAEATASTGATVTYTSPATSDNVDAAGTATCSPASGSLFAIGTTTVTCNATDSSGNTATSTTFKVIVHDTTAPVITLNGSSTVNVLVGNPYVDAGATATDSVDGNLTANIATSSTPGPVNTSSTGTFTIHYNVSDAAGNAATEVTRTVIVSATPLKLVNAEDFGVMDLSGVKGYNVGFGLVNATATDTQSIVVTLYNGTTTLAVATSTGIAANYPNATDLSAPFDVYGNFDYAADGNWSYSGWLGSKNTIPTSAVITVHFKDGTTATATNTNLTGDPTQFFKEITSFVFAGTTPTSTGVINEATHTITVVVPPGTDLTNLVPTITLSSASATTTPASGVAHDFSTSTVYTVTAGDSTTQPYTVNVIAGAATSTITASAGANGSISPSGAVVVNYGDTQNFTITPASGYRIDNVLVDGVSVGGVSTYSFPNVTANHTISATFALNTVGGGGGGGGGGSAVFTAPQQAPGQVLGAFIDNTNPTTSNPFGTGFATNNNANSTQGQVLGASAFRFTLNLKLRMRNSDVMELQKQLQTLGFFKTTPTGYFGPVTLAAVKAYQKAHKIVPVSGFFGPLTRASLNALLGS